MMQTNNSVPSSSHQPVENETLGCRLHAIQKTLPELTIIREGRVGPDTFRLRARLGEISADYDLLRQFMLAGGNDPQRDQLYRSLCQRVQQLEADVRMRQLCMKGSMKTAENHAAGLSANPDDIMQAMERWLDMQTAEVMMGAEAGEEKEDKDQPNGNHLHHQYMSRLFDAILVSPQWDEARSRAMTRLLMAPEVDSDDAQLMMSAIMLSALQVFDAGKWLTMAAVALQTDDESLRQRALVGLALTLPKKPDRMADKIESTLRDLCMNPGMLRQLVELQKQVFFCISARDDQELLQRDVFPTIYKNSPLRRNGRLIIEMDEESSIDDIINPDREEREMEAMEKSINIMQEMEKNGSDVYFGGFSQMKRFAFFYDLSNWFCPYTPTHPGLEKVRQNETALHLLDNIQKRNLFCDSDKYSFALALASVIDRLPANIKEMLSGDAAFPDNLSGFDIQNGAASPAVLRRSYLQGLYRFFNLYTSHQDFCNPFDYSQSNGFAHFFFANPMMRRTLAVDQMPQLAAFLYKRGRYDELIHLLRDVSVGKNADTLTLLAMAWKHKGEMEMAEQLFSRALLLRADNEQALRGKAQTAFALGDYEQAESCYRQLLQKHPDTRSFALNHAITLVYLDRAREALAILYRLDYEQPDDCSVRRAIAWAALYIGDYERAEVQYQWLVADEREGKRESSDMLYAAYTKWFLGKISDAVSLFHRYLAAEPKASLMSDLHSDARLLLQAGISTEQAEIMFDLVMG